MPHIVAQVTIPYRSGLPEDVAVNTFHFTGVDDVEDMCTAIFGRMQLFYNTAYGSSSRKICQLLSNEVAITAARVKMYDMAEPEPRPPVFDESLGLTGTPTAATNLPSEVALCASYAAAPMAGEVAARRRGRVYIGPLNTAASDGGSGTTPARPATTTREILAEASEAMAAANTLGAQWVVWSRRNDSASEIVRGWVDNAFDTQRRRGPAATSRLSWEVEV